MTALVWMDDGRGYQCPQCGLWVCIPKQVAALCPRCPEASAPLEEWIYDALEGAGFDETDAGEGTKAVMAVLAEQGMAS